MSLELKTDHPYIIRVEGMRGGRPIIKGTGIQVALIVKLYKMGESVDEMLLMYPYLTPAMVYDALSYYHDHQQEVEQHIMDEKLEAVLERNNLLMDATGRIIPIPSTQA